ncbi:MAG: phosphate-starvation-inducible PsiE family protein [Nitrospirota bacterium]|nr:phosphate-starvation-inducible PsiE family protein [Nitrospirota bacterium]
MNRKMIYTSMEQTLSNGWPRRFVTTLTAYDMTRVWEAGTRFILSLLTLTILLGLAGGVVKTFLDLRLLLSADLEVALRHIIVDALTLLAVVEVLRTTLTYCSDGRVRVTFIVDTVLVVMLTEIISRWFTGGEWHQFAILGGIVITLGLMRIVAIRYSPSPTGCTQQAGQSGPSLSQSH